MSEQQAIVVEKSLIGSCALIALLLLASFYSVVSGAVDRAARQRPGGVAAVAQAVADMAAPATARPASRGNALLARAAN